MTDDLLPRLTASLGDAFRVERELGGGGMSRVFLATEHALERRVVVKVLDLHDAAGASADRFRREVKVIAQLQHPHVVPVLTAGGDDTLLWYVMPYVTGESLRAKLVREGALPVGDAVGITREVLDALATAHARGIVHRDIKPENILLEGRHAMVADFGVAKALADAGVNSGLTTAGVAIGTPTYMAPEQAMGDATTNHRADLYALGAVLYEMLVGAPPFSGTAQAVIAAHLTAPAPSVTERRGDVPPAVAQVIARMLAKQPAERPQSAQEVLTLLDGLTTPGGTPLAATLSTPVAIPAPGRKRNVAAIGAGVALVAATLAWVALRPPPSPYAAGAEVIAVLPFASTGDEALTRLGRDLVVTVSTNLDGVGSLRAVDFSTMLQVAQRLSEPIPLEDAREAARKLGAGSVVHGALTSDGAGVRIDAALVSVRSGETLARLRILGPRDDIRTLTDSLSTELLRQIWRRGSPPSPYLADVATANGDALRAFLAGERAFSAGQPDSALLYFAEATRADPEFAQGWLRRDYVRAWMVFPVDSTVRRRVVETKHRLPARDRELFELRSLSGLSTRARIDSGRVLADRYPDHYLAQYQVGDNIIHGGPSVGVPIAEALPYLERLKHIDPENSDIAYHRLFVAYSSADTVEMLAAAEEVMALAPRGSPLHDGARLFRAAVGSRSGDVMGLDSMVAQMSKAARAMVAEVPEAFFGPLLYSLPNGVPSTRDSLSESFLRDPALASVRPAMRFGFAMSSVGRGDLAGAMPELRAWAGRSAPAYVRTQGAFVAVTGAWMGMLPVAEAADVVASTRQAYADRGDQPPPALLWADGILAITAEDSSGLQRVLRALEDTTATNRRRARQLRGLWRERRTQQVDSLIAAEDDNMMRAGLLDTSLPIVRAAIGRGLRRAGRAAEAERYLQWTDDIATAPLRSLVITTWTPINSYERGLAAEDAGDRAAAAVHYVRFLRGVDKPPPALQAAIADARRRLDRLSADQR